MRLFARPTFCAFGLLFLSLALTLEASEIGQQFTGKDLVTGKEIQISLSKPNVKATVIVFLSASCPCSESNMARLNALFEEFEPKGFQFIGIHSNKEEPRAEEFFRGKFPKQSNAQKSVRFPVIEDNEQILANRFEAVKTPHVFILSSEASPQILFKGGVDSSSVLTSSDQEQFSPSQTHYLRDALEKIRNGEKPKLNSVRVLGCIIQR